MCHRFSQCLNGKSTINHFVTSLKGPHSSGASDDPKREFSWLMSLDAHSLDLPRRCHCWRTILGLRLKLKQPL
ncbi:hypothetical protein EMIT0232MI5_100238 [Pseudomonas sp. IT-232MI5]